MDLDYNTIWFVLVGVLLTGYALLDGFDLGVGALHLFSKKDEDRRILLNAIGPVWDGNEVWLVTGGGALFAAFPEVYATAFSGFYTAFMLLLFALIFRAVAIEFRSKQPMKWWRHLWDFSFSAASILSSILIGVAMGNIVWGVPLNEEGIYQGNFLSLLHPYSLLMGMVTLALFIMHGSIYLVMKTEGKLHDEIRIWVKRGMIFFIVSFVILTVATLIYIPRMADVLRDHPVFFLIPLVNIMAIANIPREITNGRDGWAFISSCVAMISLMALFGINVYPNLIYSNPNPQWSLDIYNAASSEKTLKIMFFMACLGVPLVLAYTVSIYWIFRGKVKLTEVSY